MLISSFGVGGQGVNYLSLAQINSTCLSGRCSWEGSHVKLK